MERSYFVVEGPHDVQVIGRLLRERELQRIRLMEDVDPYWQKLIPRGFPHKGDLLKRVPAPTFFLSDGYSVAVQAAGGDAESISKTIRSSFLTLDSPPDGVGVVVDADFEIEPHAVWSGFSGKFPDDIDDIGSEPGGVGTSLPRTGIYVLPDNSSQGTLEDVLLPCAQRAYPALTEVMTNAINPLDPDDQDIFPRSSDRKQFKKPAGRKKAIIGAVANLLRPGKAVQVSIQDNGWLRRDALDLQLVKSLQRFVDEVAGFSTAP